MRRNRSVFLLCWLVLAKASGAAPPDVPPPSPPQEGYPSDSTGLLIGNVSWSSDSIESNMRRNGCFTPPVVTVRDALHSKDAFCRYLAIRDLGERGERDAVPELERIQATDPIESNRNEAAIELIRLGERSYLENARRVMEQLPGLRERVYFAGRLADVGDASGFPYLERACRSSVLEDRDTCRWVLGRFKKVAEQDPRLLEALADVALLMADDPNQAFRKDALLVLDGFAYTKSLPVSVLDRLEALSVSSPYLDVREIASSTIQHQQESPNRLFEIYRLGRRGSKSDIPNLKKIFESDPDARARINAAFSLVRLGERGYLVAIRKAMNESLELNDKVSLAGELAALGDGSGFHYVEEACRSSDPDTRRGGAAVLSEFYELATQDQHLMEVLLESTLLLAEDPDSKIRAIAIPALEGYGRGIALPEAIVMRLKSMASSSRYPEVQEMARTAIEEQKRQKQEVKEPKP